MSHELRLSVVVTIVDGGATLERCLRALTAQHGSPSIEVLVPWDDSVEGIKEFAARFPAFHFLPLGNLSTVRPPTSLSGQHELFDKRRSAGLAAATGDVVALLEDRGAPEPGWASALIRHHELLPHAAVGGAIEDGQPGLLHSAVYFCDFSRYQRPFEAGPTTTVSDVNVGYKRNALDRVRAAWTDRYHEPVVHAALRALGETLFLAPDVGVVERRDGLRLGALLAERFAWGRLFAHQRIAGRPGLLRLGLAAATPILPFLLTWRMLLQAIRRAHVGRFLSASPVVLMLVIAWSLGELVGYATSDS